MHALTRALCAVQIQKLVTDRHSHAHFCAVRVRAVITGQACDAKAASKIGQAYEASEVIVENIQWELRSFLLKVGP